MSALAGAHCRVRLVAHLTSLDSCVSFLMQPIKLRSDDPSSMNSIGWFEDAPFVFLSHWSNWRLIPAEKAYYAMALFLTEHVSIAPYLHIRPFLKFGIHGFRYAKGIDSDSHGCVWS